MSTPQKHRVKSHNVACSLIRIRISNSVSHSVSPGAMGKHSTQAPWQSCLPTGLDHLCDMHLSFFLF